MGESLTPRRHAGVIISGIPVPRITEHLDAARAGDALAFAELVDPLRGELHAHCYRMLGSSHDADDALQEALVRAWRGLDQYSEGGALRAWLYRIATNRCLSLLERRGRRELPVDMSPGSAPLVESAWVEPYPGARLEWTERLDPEQRMLARETVELAFIAALQHLTPNQRATVLLRDVLEYSARETAEQLTTSVASVTSALQRARRTLDELVPEASQQQTRRELGDARVRALAEAYAAAWEAGDVEAILATLSEDAKYSMPPRREWYPDREGIRGFVADLAAPGRWRFLVTEANGQVAFGTYDWDRATGAYEAAALDVAAVRGDLISEVVSFLECRSFAAFDLPARLPPGSD